MKFFIGIVPPQEIHRKILTFQRTFDSNKVPYFNEPHITLKAPSGLTEDMTWLPQVKSIAGRHKKFTIQLKGLDAFNSRVLFLNLLSSKELSDLHLELVSYLVKDLTANNKFFEGELFHPHLTLGETTWGGMTTEELEQMAKEANKEFKDPMSFEVTFVRIFKKIKDGAPYIKLMDIPLGL